jgi:hypothetical protein
MEKVKLNDGREQYIPNEIKVVTMYGQKHYDKTKAWFRESKGFQMLPENYSKLNIPIADKASLYGIPPYYYTQLQQQIFGCDNKEGAPTPFGYLTVLFDNLWEVFTYFIWRDQKVIDQLILEDTKTWNTIEKKRPANFTLNVPILDENGKETGEIR